SLLRMTRSHTVKLYYDIISPYSFIGFESLLRYRVVWPIDVVLKPICMGGLFRDVGNKPPVKSCEAKATYMAKEIEMIARHFGVPMNVPKNFSEHVMDNSTIDACRLIIATQRIDPEKAETVSRQLFSRFWIENMPVNSEEDIKKQRSKSRDQRSIQVLKKLNMTNVKEMLEQIKKEDVKEEAFGMPWISVTKMDGSSTENYFGSDRLPIIGEFIGQNYHGPLRHLSLY
ncbi:hypothetical protein PENTCL1PPCAC_4822, partial [Pristionchus entomophagus]